MRAASAKTAAAITSPSGVSSSSATTSTGTARIRSTVSTFGALTGNTDHQYQPWLSSIARAKTSSSIAAVSLPVKVFCCEGWYDPSSA